MQINQGISTSYSYNTPSLNNNRANKSNYTVSGLKDSDTVTFRRFNLQIKDPIERNKFQLTYAVEGFNDLEKAMEDIVPLLEKQRELAVDSSKWYYSNIEREYMHAEMKMIDEEINKIMGFLAKKFDDKIVTEFFLADDESREKTNYLKMAMANTFLDLNKAVAETDFLENEDNAALFKEISDALKGGIGIDFNSFETLKETVPSLIDKIRNSDISENPAVMKALESFEEKMTAAFESQWLSISTECFGEKYKDVEDSYRELNKILGFYNAFDIGPNIKTKEGAEAAIESIDKTIEMMKELGKDITEEVRIFEEQIKKFGINITKNEVEITKNTIIKNAGEAVVSHANISKQAILSLVK